MGERGGTKLETCGATWGSEGPTLWTRNKTYSHTPHHTLEKFVPARAILGQIWADFRTFNNELLVTSGGDGSRDE